MQFSVTGDLRQEGSNYFLDSHRHPVFTIMSCPPESDERLQEVGETFFPCAFAADLGGDGRFAERAVVEQAGEQGHLFGERGGPRGFGGGREF